MNTIRPFSPARIPHQPSAQAIHFGSAALEAELTKLVRLGGVGDEVYLGKRMGALSKEYFGADTELKIAKWAIANNKVDELREVVNCTKIISGLFSRNEVTRMLSEADLTALKHQIPTNGSGTQVAMFLVTEMLLNPKDRAAIKQALLDFRSHSTELAEALRNFPKSANQTASTATSGTPIVNASPAATKISLRELAAQFQVTQAPIFDLTPILPEEPPKPVTPAPTPTPQVPPAPFIDLAPILPTNPTTPATPVTPEPTPEPVEFKTPQDAVERKALREEMLATFKNEKAFGLLCMLLGTTVGKIGHEESLPMACHEMIKKIQVLKIFPEFEQVIKLVKQLSTRLQPAHLNALTGVMGVPVDQPERFRELYAQTTSRRVISAEFQNIAKTPDNLVLLLLIYAKATQQTDALKQAIQAFVPDNAELLAQVDTLAAMNDPFKHFS